MKPVTIILIIVVLGVVWFMTKQNNTTNAQPANLKD